MAGTVRQAKVESKTSRSKLKRGREPHWRTITPGRAHLGYQRKDGAQQGRWLLRRFDGRHYRVEALGPADDADDGAGLTFEAAMALATEKAGAPANQSTGKLTVRKALALYLDHLKAMGRSTRDAEGRAAVRITPVLGDVLVTELTADTLRRWLSKLGEAPAMMRTRRGAAQKFREHSADDAEAIRRRRSTANRTWTVLRAALNFAFSEGLVSTDNAWKRVKAFRDVDAARVRFLSIAEAQRLLNGCSPEFRPLARAALETGARYGELARLLVVDFNREAGTVHIRKSKTGKARHIVLTPEGAAFFQTQTVGRAGDALMFERARGGHWNGSAQTAPMRQACERAGIKPAVGFHQLRHSWASHATMNGVPLLIVAQNLGHTSTRMAERNYAHLSASHVKAAILAGAPRYGQDDNTTVVPLEGVKAAK
jgi:integrase